MNLPSTLEISPKLAELFAAVEKKLNPEQRAIFYAALTDKLASLLPIVEQVVERSQTAAAMMSDLPPGEQVDLYAQLARGLGKLVDK